MNPSATSPQTGDLLRAMEQSFNAVMMTDAEPGPHGPRILYVNPAFCRMSGYSEEELLGKTPRILQGPATNPDVLARLRDCLRDGTFFTGSTVNYRKDGSKTAEEAALWGGTAGQPYDPCYHAACDTYANNNDIALDVNSDAVAYAVLQFSMNTTAINGKRAKGNFKMPEGWDQAHDHDHHDHHGHGPGHDHGKRVAK